MVLNMESNIEPNLLADDRVINADEQSKTALLVIGTLVKDCNRISIVKCDHPAVQQHLLRILVRAYSALFEATLNHIERLMMDTEISNKVTEHHRKELDTLALDLKVPFLLDLFAELNGLSWKIERGSNLEDFRLFLELRDRITHPGGRLDLIFSDDDVRLVNRSCRWFMEQVGELMKAYGKT